MVSQEDEILQLADQIMSVNLLDVPVENSTGQSDQESNVNPSNISSDPKLKRIANERSATDKTLRPFDIVRSNGRPQNPLPFDAPQVSRGRRDTVLVWTNNEHQQYHNVLFTDDLKKLSTAYWTIPHKQPIKTIMGHVQICLMLRRCSAELDSDNDDDNDDDDNFGTESENEGSDDEDIVFQLTSEYVAIKVNYCSRIEALRNKHAEDPMKEIAAMAWIGNEHKNVLGCREVLFDGRNINVVMSYCRSGDLFALLQDCHKLPKPGLPEERARFYMRQILLGVQHLHRKGICHRDLSPENIMLDEGGCVVIDMGMCLRIPYLDNHGAVVDGSKGQRRLLIHPQGPCGKLSYMSPEIYASRVPFDGPAVDIWSCGVVLFCMLTGNRSYYRPHRSDSQFYWMTHGIDTLLANWDVSLSSEAVDLLRGMLQMDPRERLTLQEVMNHAWFR